MIFVGIPSTLMTFVQAEDTARANHKDGHSHKYQQGRKC